MNVAFLCAIVSIGPTFILGLCQQYETRPEPKPWRQLTTVFFGKGKGPNVCACHIDFKRYSATDIEHYPFRGMPTCESEPDPQNVWTKVTEPPWSRSEVGTTTQIAAVWIDVGYDGHHEDHELKYGEGEYRWHCTEDSEYLK